MSAPFIRPNVIHINRAPSGWKTNPQFVYIGRPGKGLTSDFGNLFTVALYGREGCLQRYADYVAHRIKTDPLFRAKVKALAGKTLVCFCKPLDCHGDILADWCVKLN